MDNLDSRSRLWNGETWNMLDVMVALCLKRQPSECA